MKAAVLTQLNAPLELWDVALPFRPDGRHCGPSQVLIDVRMSGICGSQLKEIGGEKGNKDFLPHLLGHEGSGIVRETGPGVNAQLIGKKVVAHWRKGDGGESIHPARYDVRGGTTVGGGHVTTLCEQAIVSANRITVVADDVPDELCALLGCGLSTALGTIEQEAKLKFGESILIVGCGGVGLNLIQAAKLACAWPIIATDIHDTKIGPSREMGAHRFVNATEGADKFKEALHCRGQSAFDVIVDSTGSVEALEKTIPLLADGGRYVMLGQTKPEENFRVLSAVNLFHGNDGRRIIWSQGGGFRPSTMIPRYVNLWRAGLLNLEGIVSHHLPLAEVNRGIELVRAGQAGRIMIGMK